jgi:hypothetical protein
MGELVRSSASLPTFATSVASMSMAWALASSYILGHILDLRPKSTSSA